MRTGWGALVLGLACGLWMDAARADTVSLTELARNTMAAYFSEKTVSAADLIRPLAQVGDFRKPAGVFVTLSRQGKTRACWGSVHPQHKDIAEATVQATLGALTKEYRYPPIRRSEWRELRIQVTVIREVIPVTGMQEINPLRDGLMVRAGSRSGVMLPGEARDAHFQLVQAKLKAGIQPGQKFQMYRIAADVYQ